MSPAPGSIDAAAGQADASAADPYAPQVHMLEGRLGFQLGDDERLVASRWFKLGAPLAHVAVVIRNDRLPKPSAAADADRAGRG